MTGKKFKKLFTRFPNQFFFDITTKVVPTVPSDHTCANQ